MFVVKRAKSRKELFVLPKIKGLFGESILCMQNRLVFALQEIVEVFMLQIKKLNLTHKKDLKIILDNFNLVLNAGD